jgi:hypothetical protein
LSSLSVGLLSGTLGHCQERILGGGRCPCSEQFHQDFQCVTSEVTKFLCDLFCAISFGGSEAFLTLVILSNSFSALGETY